MPIRFSCIIPALNKNDPKLKDLLASIKTQDFPQDQIEIDVITDGDAESSRAIGIKRAKGDICVMLCTDNYLTNSHLFKHVSDIFSRNEIDCVYERHYAYVSSDNSLNRYFSLIGNNDPVPFYLGKCDREPYIKGLYVRKGVPTLGCNGFFVRRKRFKDANLDHYYHIDAHVDMNNSKKGMRYAVLETGTVWHRTSDNLLTFLRKRYRYARDLYCDRKDRRWRMVDSKEDYFRLAVYIVCALTVVQPVFISIKGFRGIRDFAWFWHPVVCLGFLVTYTILGVRTWINRLLSPELRGRMAHT